MVSPVWGLMGGTLSTTHRGSGWQSHSPWEWRSGRTVTASYRCNVSSCLVSSSRSDAGTWRCWPPCPPSTGRPGPAPCSRLRRITSFSLCHTLQWGNQMYFPAQDDMSWSLWPDTVTKCQPCSRCWQADISAAQCKYNPVFAKPSKLATSPAPTHHTHNTQYTIYRAELSTGQNHNWRFC